MATYHSGGLDKYRDQEKFDENFKRIFGSRWPCSHCKNDSAKGHKPDCPEHWRNKK